MAHARTMESFDITATNSVTAVKEEAEHRTTGIGADAMVVEPTIILQITVGQT